MICSYKKEKKKFVGALSVLLQYSINFAVRME